MADDLKIGPWNLEEYKALSPEEVAAYYGTGKREIDFDLAKYIQHLLKCKNALLEMEGTELLARKKELDHEIRFLNKVLSSLNDASDKKSGEVNVKGSADLQKLIKEAEAKNKEADEILSIAGKEIERSENLRNAGKQRLEESKLALEEGNTEEADELKKSGEALLKEAKEIDDQHRPNFERGNLLKDSAKPVLRLKEFEKLNKENRQLIIENINSMISEIDTLRKVSDQQMSDLNQKRNTFALYFKMIAQSLHAIMVAPLKNMR